MDISHNLEWIFGGVGVPAMVWLINYLIKKRKKNSDNNQLKIADTSYTKTELPKNQTRILFVDDKHTDFKMVSILKKSGWINTKSIKDVTDLNDPKVIEAEIIFVDINGVGTTLFQDQGLGLASALKKKYRGKKIVIYSSETTGDRFHKALREVDDCLHKEAEPYQFINLIESFIKNK
ncbi:MAG: response regulator [Bacteroidetes bacterium]|nr:response regulator [Bacteroidota bacterium]